MGFYCPNTKENWSSGDGITEHTLAPKRVLSRTGTFLVPHAGPVRRQQGFTMQPSHYHMGKMLFFWGIVKLFIPQSSFWTTRKDQFSSVTIDQCLLYLFLSSSPNMLSRCITMCQSGHRIMDQEWQKSCSVSEMNHTGGCKLNSSSNWAASD